MRSSEEIVALAERKRERPRAPRMIQNTGTPTEMELDKSGRSVTLTPASSFKVRPVRWLWSDRIALGTLALLAGREGIGKSTLAYQLAADITQGRLLGVHWGTPKAVIVAATEDSWEHTIVPRCMAAGADLDRVYRADVTTPEGFRGLLTLPTDIEALRESIEAVGAALVLLDPLVSRLSPTLDTHKDAEVRQALEPLVALADRTGVSVLGLIHVSKSVSTDPLTLVMGSRAFPAVARAVLFCMTDPDDEKLRVMSQPKNNLGRSDLPSLTFTIASEHVATTDEGDVIAGRIVWAGETRRGVREMLASSGESREDRTATQDASGWLDDYLSMHKVAESQSVKSEGRKAGHSERTLARARERIGAGTYSHGFPRRTYWSAPGLTPDATERILSGATSLESGITGTTGTTGTTEPSHASCVSHAIDVSPQAPLAPLDEEPF